MLETAAICLQAENRPFPGLWLTLTPGAGTGAGVAFPKPRPLEPSHARRFSGWAPCRPPPLPLVAAARPVTSPQLLCMKDGLGGRGGMLARRLGCAFLHCEA